MITCWKAGTLEKITTCLAWAGLALLWGLAFFFNHRIKGAVPVHFTLQGQADAFGGSESLYGLALVNTVLVPALLWLRNKPHYMNFGAEVTPENKPLLYPIMRETIGLFTLALLVIAFALFYETVCYRPDAAPYLFLIIFVVLKMPLIFYFYKKQHIS